MQYKNIYKNLFSFNVRFSWKTITLLAMLAILPNLLGMFHTSVFGVRIHFFQYLVFLAAILYGPKGGAISGGTGSVFTAIALNNPYIIIGNIMLGFFVGLFVRLKLHVMLAVMLAYLIQLPWLWMTDVYLAGMPIKAVNMIVVALFVSNIIWAFVALKTHKHVKKLVV